MVDHKPVKSYPSTVPPSNVIDGRSMAQFSFVSSWLFHALFVVMSIIDIGCDVKASLVFIYMGNSCLPGPEGFFFILNSTEHEIFPAHKCKNANNCWHLSCMSGENSILGLYEFKKS